MFKKLLAILLACLMMIPCVVALAEAETLTCEGYKYILNDDGSATIVDYTGDPETLIIPAELDGHPVTAIGDEAFTWFDILTSVTIPDSVTSLGANPFSDCAQLAQIIISPDHPTLETIDGVLFDKTTQTLICYPDGLTAESYEVPQGTQAIGGSAFSCGFSLTSITIPDSVTSIGDSAFAWCTSLTSITIPNSVTSIGTNPFANCKELSQLIVSPDHPTLETINGVLFDKTTQTLVYFPQALTAKTYAVPEGTQAIGNWAFYSCDNLTSVTIPDSVTSIGDSAFAWCRSLTSISIPDSVTFIGDQVFDFCKSLTSITIPDSVTTIGANPFVNCSQLTQITVSSNHPTLETIDGVLFDKTTQTLICYPCVFAAESYAVPQGIQAIGANAFSWCSSLTSITIPDSVTSIGNEAFSSCSSLASIIIPNGVTSIGNEAFSSCSSLASITLPGSVTFIGDEAFINCSSLASITLPDNVTFIGDMAFAFCNSLASVTIPDGISSIGTEAFMVCPNLTLTVPQNSYVEAYAMENGIPYTY